MGILKAAVNEQAFLKAGIFGNAGSGKTTTASFLAMAIAKTLGERKPVAFFETEAGSDFMLERFKVEGLELLRVKSHSLAHLLEAAKEAEQACSVLIVDSISHVWNDLTEAKLTAINKAREIKAKKSGWKFSPIDKLEFQHYADIKREWARWTNVFLNSRLHVIVCGRAGNIWEYETNDETGKKELQKAGTKMKAEGEFGYEPSLLIEMERIGKGDEKGGWKHRATVLKDRTDTINGYTFDFEKPRKAYKEGDWKQTFKPFEQVFKHLNIGGEHMTYAPSNTDEMFPVSDGGESKASVYAKQCDFAAEEIAGLMQVMYPGQDAQSKAIRQTINKAIFDTYSWKAIESKPLAELQFGVRALELYQEKSRGREFTNLEDLEQLVRDCVLLASDNNDAAKEVMGDDQPPAMEAV